jgi:chromosomal replication initiation ATPase DnaA
MKNYIICYNGGVNVQQEFLDELRSFQYRWFCMDNINIVRTKKSLEELFEIFSAKINDKDKLVITEICSPALHTGYNDKCETWLNQYLS